ncbi:YjiH family protein, partial [Vibrio diabolicus]|nr:YjiH family protein [Vibrio diabolicus]
AVTSSIGLAVAVMFVFKIVGANLFRIYLNLTEGKEDKQDNADQDKPQTLKEEAAK